MGQLTIYLPDEVEKTVRRDARRAKKTVSAYIASLTGPKTDANGYPPDFWDVFGSCPGLKAAMLKFDDPLEIPTFASTIPDRQRRSQRRPRRRSRSA